MSDHRNSTAVPKVKVGIGSRDKAIAQAMRDLEGRMHDLANMTDIMSDLVFDAFDDGNLTSAHETGHAMFAVNDVQRRVGEMKNAYLEALKADRAISPAATGLEAAIAEAERAHSAWVSSVPHDADLPEGELSDAYGKAELALINYPCRSCDEIIAKMTYLHERKTEAAKTVFCTFVDLHNADAFLASLLGKEV